jgi:hypothetical protein
MNYSVSEITIPIERDPDAIASCTLLINKDIPLEDLRIVSLIPPKIEVIKKPKVTPLLKSAIVWTRPLIGAVCGYLAPLWAPSRWNINFEIAEELGPMLVCVGLIDGIFQHYYQQGSLKSPLWNFAPGMITAVNFTLNLCEKTSLIQTLFGHLSYRVAHCIFEILTE